MKAPWEDKDNAKTPWGTLRAIMKGVQLPELFKRDIRKLQGTVRGGKKEKQKNWNESGETEICLHCTFLLTVHIHLQQIHCLFLLCQVSFSGLPVLWGFVGKQFEFSSFKSIWDFKKTKCKGSPAAQFTQEVLIIIICMVYGNSYLNYLSPFS